MQNEELRRTQAELEASRARYFDLYDLAPVGYITLDEEDRIVESNLRAATLFGITHSALNRRKFSEWIGSGDGDLYYLTRKRLIQTSEPQVCELRLRKPRDAQFWVRLEMSMSQPEEETGTRVCRIVIIDIADRKFAEQRFYAFMDNSHAGASIVDDEGRYVYVNPAMQRHTGRSLNAWIGKTFSEIWPDGISETMKRRHERVLTSNQASTETETLPHSGRQAVYQVLRFPLAGPQGRRMVGCISVDVTHHHQLETALKESNERLELEKRAAEEATRAKSLFLSAMSHEIRTPLNGVIGMAGLLLYTPLSDEQINYARTVSDSAEALLSVVNDILDFSKIEAGKLELEEVPFDLETVIEDCLSLLSFKAREKQIELACWYAAQAPRLFVGDAGRIRQVLINLISNAVKFTEKGYVLVEVEVTKPVDGVAGITISVHDTGIGISQEDQEKLFTPFRQADSTISKRFGGSGLGLFIVSQILGAMKGKASVSSMEGEGSTFRAEMPLAVRRDATAPLAEGEERRLENVSVLIAGGQHVGRFVVSEWCRRWAMKVELCDTANVIRSMMDAGEQDRGFELVIVEGSAETLGQAVFAIHAAAGDGARPKVILISSDTAEKTRYLEADAVLYSPVRSNALWKAIAELGLGVGKNRLPGAEISQDKSRAVKYKVLVTDDNLVNQRLTSALLSRMGCRVDVAENGLRAVQKVSENDYELVFMDCVMPEMDGFAATTAIRSLEGQCRRVPIVALTASATIEDREHCFAAGMDDFLTKPIHSEQLADCLSKWLKGFDSQE